ncbi:MAG: hypothetical protein ACOX7J_03440 [Bacillota bacterium]|jgi:hypothetical protein
MEDKLVFSTTDPRGLGIRCSKEQWENHIIQNHSIMDGKEGIVKKTVSKPDYIYEDKNNPHERNVYVKNDDEKTYPADNMCTKVVVAVGGGYGDVITTYPAKSNRNNYEGELLYEKSGKC